MILWGNYDRDRQEESGRFDCPQCACETEFVLIRTWNYFHIYFIPLARQELVAERVVCLSCNCAFPVTVLVGSAKSVPSAFESSQTQTNSLSGNFGNVVELTAAAIAEIRRRHAAGRFDSSVVVRVEPDSWEARKVSIAFDFPLADGRDWIGQSHGTPLVVDRRVAAQLQGATIDFRDGEFIRT